MAPAKLLGVAWGVGRETSAWNTDWNTCRRRSLHWGATAAGMTGDPSGSAARGFYACSPFPAWALILAAQISQPDRGGFWPRPSGPNEPTELGRALTAGG